MKKTDKALENTIVKVLTHVCEQSLKEINGFQWLTHLVNYKDFPRSLTVICIFETQDKSSQFKFDDPSDCIEWIYRNNEPAGKGSELSKRIEELEIKTDNLYVFGAGEAKQISSIRKILKQKFDLKADQMSFTGYWKRTD